MASREITATRAWENVINADETAVLVGASVPRIYLPLVDATLPNCVKEAGHTIRISVPGISPVQVLTNTGVNVGTLLAHSTTDVELVATAPTVWRIKP